MAFKHGKKNEKFFSDNGDKRETVESKHESAEQVITEGDLSKVRDLLFGGQAREQRDETTRIEAELIQQTSNIRAEMGKNIASVEKLVSDVKSEVFDRIYTETTERKGAADSIIKKLSEIEVSFGCKIAEIDKKRSRAEAELCDRFLSQCTLLGDQISQRHEEAVKISNDHFAKLKASKIDRSELGSILVEIGMRFDAEKYGLPLHPEETQLVPKMDGPVNPGGPSLSSGVTGAAKSR